MKRLIKFYINIVCFHNIYTYMSNQETELEELPGSGKIDGSGFTLGNPVNRRDR